MGVGSGEEGGGVEVERRVGIEGLPDNHEFYKPTKRTSEELG